MSGSKLGSTRQSWTDLPSKILLKVVLAKWYGIGLKRKIKLASLREDVVQRFRHHFPFAQRLFKHSLTDAAISGRALTAFAKSKPGERIEVNKTTKPYLTRADYVLKLCAEGHIWTHLELERVADLERNDWVLPERAQSKSKPCSMFDDPMVNAERLLREALAYVEAARGSKPKRSELKRRYDNFEDVFAPALADPRGARRIMEHWKRKNPKFGDLDHERQIQARDWSTIWRKAFDERRRRRDAGEDVDTLQKVKFGEGSEVLMGPIAKIWLDKA